MAGNYSHGIITIEGDVIKIDRSKFGRPIGVGKMVGNKGEINFPDFRTFKLEYDPV